MPLNPYFRFLLLRAPKSKIALDLYSGTGDATAAFRSHPGWYVVAVDIASDVGRPSLEGGRSAAKTPDVLADCRALPVRGAVDFLWSSPPCQEFSTAAPGRGARRPSLEHIVATLNAVRDLRPRFWILENVVGAVPFLGIPAQKIGPFCLWGYFPRIDAPLSVVTHRKIDPRRRTAAARAAIPWELSVAVYLAVERAWSSERLLDLRPYRRHRHVAKLKGRPASS